MARKMRMNTEARKNLFCALMSADDYLDAFERLVKVDKAAAAAGTRERDTAFVILTCCLKEVRCWQPQVFSLSNGYSFSQTSLIYASLTN